MVKVAIYEDSSTIRLEKSINDFIRIEKCKVIDIQYRVRSDSFFIYSAMVIYETKEEA